MIHSEFRDVRRILSSVTATEVVASVFQNVGSSSSSSIGNMQNVTNCNFTNVSSISGIRKMVDTDFTGSGKNVWVHSCLDLQNYGTVVRNCTITDCYTAVRGGSWYNFLVTRSRFENNRVAVSLSASSNSAAAQQRITLCNFVNNDYNVEANGPVTYNDPTLAPGGSNGSTVAPGVNYWGSSASSVVASKIRDVCVGFGSGALFLYFPYALSPLDIANPALSETNLLGVAVQNTRVVACTGVSPGSNSSTPSPGTQIGPLVFSSLTLTAANSPYVVASGSTIVYAGATLTIEGGVEIVFDAGATLIIRGSVVMCPIPGVTNTNTNFAGARGLYDSLNAIRLTGPGQAWSGTTSFQLEVENAYLTLDMCNIVATGFDTLFGGNSSPRVRVFLLSG